MATTGTSRGGVGSIGWAGRDPREAKRCVINGRVGTTVTPTAMPPSRIHLGRPARRHKSRQLRCRRQDRCHSLAAALHRSRSPGRTPASASAFANTPRSTCRGAADLGDGRGRGLDWRCGHGGVELTREAAKRYPGSDGFGAGAGSVSRASGRVSTQQAGECPCYGITATGARQKAAFPAAALSTLTWQV